MEISEEKDISLAKASPTRVMKDIGKLKKLEQFISKTFH